MSRTLLCVAAAAALAACDGGSAGGEPNASTANAVETPSNEESAGSAPADVRPAVNQEVRAPWPGKAPTERERGGAAGVDSSTEGANASAPLPNGILDDAGGQGRPDGG